MALSNAFREPVREAVETAIGLAAVGGFVYADYLLVVWVHARLPPFGDGSTVPLAVVMALGLPAAFFVVLVLHFAHSVGEEVCAKLAARGLDPRPRRRR